MQNWISRHSVNAAFLSLTRRCPGTTPVPVPGAAADGGAGAAVHIQ